MECAGQSGLHLLAQMGEIMIDRALTSGLFERWHPKTNFPSSKVIVEDMSYIYDLHVDDPIIIGRTFPNSRLLEICLDVLGRAPQLGPDVNGINIKFT